MVLGIGYVEKKIVKYIKIAEKERESFLKIVYNRFDTSLQRTTYC